MTTQWLTNEDDSEREDGENMSIKQVMTMKIFNEAEEGKEDQANEWPLENDNNKGEI